jgi:hypothetical protein
MLAFLQALQNVHIFHGSPPPLKLRRDSLRRGGFYTSWNEPGRDGLPSRSSRRVARLRENSYGAAAFSRCASEGWWAWVDLNHRPRPYQGRALAT